jgi:hypothetical protein
MVIVVDNRNLDDNHNLDDNIVNHHRPRHDGRDELRTPGRQNRLLRKKQDPWRAFKGLDRRRACQGL